MDFEKITEGIRRRGGALQRRARRALALRLVYLTKVVGVLFNI